VKYIIFTAADGIPRCVIFAAPLLHEAIARAHAAEGWTPKSAGFVEFLGGGHVRCFGYSNTLNLRPEPRDPLLIEVMMSATLRIAPMDTSSL
jgi:hypothetical protein